MAIVHSMFISLVLLRVMAITQGFISHSIRDGDSDPVVNKPGHTARFIFTTETTTTTTTSQPSTTSSVNLESISYFVCEGRGRGFLKDQVYQKIKGNDIGDFVFKYAAKPLVVMLCKKKERLLKPWLMLLIDLDQSGEIDNDELNLFQSEANHFRQKEKSRRKRRHNRGGNKKQTRGSKRTRNNKQRGSIPHTRRRPKRKET